MSSIHTRNISGMPDPVRRFAEMMASAQGCKVFVTKESKGYHLYLPCPDCLEQHGRKELSDPKYAINLTKHLGLLDDDDDLMFRDWHEVEHERNNRAGVCMRTRQSKHPHMFSVSNLMNMGTITERFPEIHTRAEVISTADSAERKSHWDPDVGTGVLCPPPPYESPEHLYPINGLPEGHVARTYLEERRFDLDRLWRMFRTSYCAKEYPYGRNKIFYRKMPGGWRDTPQGRIIFHAMKDGTPLTWQGRVLDRISEDGLEHYFWHPYKARWDLVETRSHPKAVWMRQEPFDARNEEGNYEWSPSKYKTAKYSERQLAGWDEAMRVNADREIRWCVICEGPLDAGRVGPGGMAVLGGSISPENAIEVADNFHIVILGLDNDKAGREAAAGIRNILDNVKSRNPMLAKLEDLRIPEGKDLGEMNQKSSARSRRETGRERAQTDC